MIIELEPIFNTENAAFLFGYELDLSSLAVSGVHPLKTPVQVSGRVFNEAGMVTLEAKAEFLYSSFCDRCAEPTECSLTVPIRHGLIVSLNDENNDDFIVVSDLRLHLDPLIEEDVILALPVKFLCKESCKGLCPICGKNLNDGPCGCKPLADPRLDGLRKLLEEE